MKKFRSITVNETTFEAVDRLSETLMPRIKLSKAQVVENLVKGSHDVIKTKNKIYHDTRQSEDN